MGIEDIASVVEHDVTAETVFDLLPKVGTVDVITMSYSFSMIPDQAGVLRSATKLLKKGGYLALVSSTLKRALMSRYESVLLDRRRISSWRATLTAAFRHSSNQ